MKTVYGRQFATMAGMILLSFLMLGASFVALSYRYTIRGRQETLERNATYIASFTSETVKNEGGFVGYNTNFQSYLATAAQVTDSHILITTNEGVVAYATDGHQTLTWLAGKTVPTTTIRSILTNGSVAGLALLTTLYSDAHYTVGLPILDDSTGTLQGLVFVSADSSNITEMWRDLSGIFIATACAVILIAAILSSVTSMRQSKPLKEIAAAARQFGHGKLDVRVDVGDRKDEVGELADAFNVMAESLASSEQRRSEFIANVSHELKTPMTTIAGFADGILDGTIPPEKEQEYLQVISSETRRLSRLVRSMLDLSRLQSDERAAQQQFDVCETILRVLVSLESKVTAKGLNVDARFPDLAVLVWGDQDAITQVCYNLLDNAIKFSRDGGELVISVTAKGSKATIAISNEGQVIPADELPLVFDRFHKTDHSRSADRDGVGLGLYIVKTILNSHKQNIVCTSEDGKTTFTFTLARA